MGNCSNVNFVFSRDGHFGLEGGGVRGVNPSSSDGVRPFYYFPGAGTLVGAAVTGAATG